MEKANNRDRISRANHLCTALKFHHICIVYLNSIEEFFFPKRLTRYFSDNFSPFHSSPADLTSARSDRGNEREIDPERSGRVPRILATGSHVSVAQQEAVGTRSSHVVCRPIYMINSPVTRTRVRLINKSVKRGREFGFESRG